MNDNTNETYPSYEARLARTEANVEALAGDLSQLTSTVSAGFRSIHDKLTDLGRPQWALVGQYVALFLTIAVLAFSPVWMSISDNATRASKLAAWRVESERELGALEERVAHLRDVIALTDKQQEVQIKRIREEVDWHWDLVHSRYGYRKPENSTERKFKTKD